jgi:nickel transport protein
MVKPDFKMNKYILKNVFGGFFFFLILLFYITDTAYAHKVMVFAWVDGDTIFTQSKFSGGKKVKGGKIAVYDNAKILLEGKTDDKGEFSFKIPEKVTLKIVLYAGAGHRAEWTVPREDIEEMSGEKPSKSTLKKPQAKTPTNRLPSEPIESRANEMPRAPKSPRPDAYEIEQAVEKVLDKKLKPVIKMLNESMDRGPTVSDILGGIGYILGLMGIGAYFHYRRRKD